MNRHRELPVWRDAQQLVGAVYALTRALPREERHVLVPQLRRAAWSVQNNIAEGNAHLGRRELRRFFDIALASLAEIDAMVATVPRVHQLTAAAQGQILRIATLRERITRGVFAILHAPGR